MFFTSVFVFASWFNIFELENLVTEDVKIRIQGTFFNSIYTSIITITSVGYGDISPQTITGKCIIMATSIWGAILLSFLVLFVINAFNLDENQTNAISHVDKNRLAAKTINNSLRYFFMKKKLHLLIQKSNPGGQSNFLNQFKAAFKRRYSIDTSKSH